LGRATDFCQLLHSMVGVQRLMPVNREDAVEGKASWRQLAWFEPGRRAEAQAEIGSHPVYCWGSQFPRVARR